MHYEYLILIARANSNAPLGVQWYYSHNNQSAGANLHLILNQLGAQGWEVIAVGDLVYDGKTDILLKKLRQ